MAQRRGQLVSGRGVLIGLGRMGVGAGKVLVLALPLERLIEGAVRALPAAHSLPLAWMSMSAFLIQLYLVVSGVVDAWIGARQVAGRGVVEVFGAPFRTVSFTDHWRHWNLPLMSALGVSADRTSLFRHGALSVAVVLLTVVIWRGATWGTAAWTALHLALLAGERWRGRSLFAPLPLPICGALTQIIVLVSGILLFMPSLHESWHHMQRLISAPPPSWYSLLLDARLSTPLPMWCLWLGLLLCVALPRASWVLPQAPRIFGVTGMLAGILGAAMLARHGPAPAADSPLAALRHLVQWPLTQILREGTAEVFVGYEGWLCRQHDLDRLTFRDCAGDGAARLLALEQELRPAQVPLLVIAIPDKATLYPEYILPREYPAPVPPPTFLPALERLRKAGITVLDATDLLWKAQKRMPVYFRLDSHWTPEAMKEVALAAGKVIRTTWPKVTLDHTPMINVSILDRSDAGDLARRLDPWDPASLEGEELAQLLAISGMEPVPDSPVLVLGGDLVRIFDDPGLSYGNVEGKRQSADFVTQLGALLGRPLAIGPDAVEMGPEVLQKTVKVAAEKRLVIAVVGAGDL